MARDWDHVACSIGSRPKSMDGVSVTSGRPAAAATSMRPAPMAITSWLRSAEPTISAILIWAGVQSWCNALSSAAAPATCGVAIDVPLNAPYLLFGSDDVIDTPGAETSGFMVIVFGVGPRDEK